jgi:hypothetical protein
MENRRTSHDLSIFYVLSHVCKDELNACFLLISKNVGMLLVKCKYDGTKQYARSILLLLIGSLADLTQWRL